MISDSKWINSNPKHLQHVLHPCSMEFSLHGVTQSHQTGMEYGTTII
jgi:hypothetical protein